MSVQILRGDALALGLADNSVDLIVTSPPYFGLRSYQDGGEHYAGQIGDEPTPAEFVDALIAATAEMVRVLKPSGSIWVNLGDKYAGRAGGPQGSSGARATRSQAATYEALRPLKESGSHAAPQLQQSRNPSKSGSVTFDDSQSGHVMGGNLPRDKSLIGIPWRYAIRCIDDLGLILRAEVIWSKPNGLPESVTDRVRRSHEQWFHFTREPRYFSAVDEIREAHVRIWGDGPNGGHSQKKAVAHLGGSNLDVSQPNPLGKLPGSVWTIPTEPLHVPESLGIDHFAAFPTEWPRRIIQGWSPSGICTACGEGRRPVTTSEPTEARAWAQTQPKGRGWHSPSASLGTPAEDRSRTITGEACACPEPTAPTRPAVVLDPFGGTGTTALVAHALGRHGISNDMSADYCRLAGWRTTDPKQLAKAARKPYTPPREQSDGQLDLLEGIA